MPNWNGEALVGAVAVIISIYAMHRENKRDRNRVAEELKKHTELVDFVMIEHPPHTHTETKRDECLTPEGIKFPKVRINGRKNND